MAAFSHFLQLARALQIPGYRRRMVRGRNSGRTPMTLSYANLHQVAASIFAALIASSLFVSAAVGTVPVL